MREKIGGEKTQPIEKNHNYDICTNNEMESTCKWYFDSQWQKLKLVCGKHTWYTNNDIENICIWYWFFIFILTYNDRH